MTPDLICLLILALWSIPLNHAPAIPRVLTAGVGWALGNRDTTPKVSPWVERADRAQRNHHDNLATIAIIIVVAHLAGQADEITAMASVAIVASRVVHGVTYIAGIGVLRSLSYFVSLLGIGVILIRLFT
ncbi:MAG: MAPEG family protein [Cyanobacteria bacterium P01_E01_bin.34]